MRVELTTPWIVGLNVVGWPVIQFAWAFAITALPASAFGDPRVRGWERRLYRRWLRVNAWKRRLPDAADWFGIGRSKRALPTTRAELAPFRRELRRGEVCHWAALTSGAVFFLWNPPWAVVIMLAVGCALNLPCIASLRYARLRLQKTERH